MKKSPPIPAKAAMSAPLKPIPESKASAAPPNPLSGADMLRIIDFLAEQEAAQVGNEPLAQAIARLIALAQQGNEEAIKALVQTGNHIASGLFILWAKPGAHNQRELLQKVAAHENHFPVSYNRGEEVRNLGWRMMVSDLAVGSAGPFRIDANQRTTSDVVDAAITMGCSYIESFKKMPHLPMADECKEFPEWVKENARALAKRIVRIWEKFDPGFQQLKSPPHAFSTLGRAFRKRQRQKTKTLQQRPDRRDDDPSEWKEFDQKQLAKMQQSDGDIRADFTDAIASRLETRLKPSPKRPVKFWGRGRIAR